MDHADRLLLQRNQLFCDIDLGSLEDLLDACPETLLAEGDTLLEQGAQNNTLYLVLEGQLRVYLGASELPEHTVLNTGECVGELSVIDGRRASALVIASQNTRLLAIDHEVIWSLIERSNRIARNLLAILSGRMRLNNLALVSAQTQSLEFERAIAVDALTGLHNKRWVADTFPRVIGRCARDGATLCLLLGDIDDFKQFTERNGHLDGDNLLRLLARELSDILRPQDMLARHGVAEFIFLLPSTGMPDARQIAERLRIMVAEFHAPITEDGAASGVTMSLGIAAMQSGDTLESLLGRATAALRRATESGRNRVEGADATVD